MSLLSEGPIPPDVQEIAADIRRNLKHAHNLLTPGDDRDSQLIDLVNHMDALAQQIEYEADELTDAGW